MSRLLFSLLFISILISRHGSDAQFNLGSVAGFLTQNPQAFNLLTQAFGGSQNAQAAANGQCVNAQNMLANTLLCAIGGNQCGVQSSNFLAGAIGQVAGGALQGFTQLIGSNPVICIIVRQACCLSNSANGGQLAGGLASLLVGNQAGGAIGNIAGGLLGGGGGGQPNLSGLQGLLGQLGNLGNLGNFGNFG